MATQLALQAKICQNAGLVPILEPAIIADNKLDIAANAEMFERVYTAFMEELLTHNILLEGMILQPNMVLEGIHCLTGEA